MGASLLDLGAEGGGRGVAPIRHLRAGASDFFANPQRLPQNANMECPHCTVSIHPAFVVTNLNSTGGDNSQWQARAMFCPSCKRAIIFLTDGVFGRAGGSVTWFERGQLFLAYPKSALRPKAPKEVPSDIAEDYNEACLVFGDSPKASAALSRRCLQAILRSQNFNQKDLAPAIQAALDSNTLPSSIAENLDAVRNIGNFAAHPTKDTSSGSVVPVEPDEAEWNLDVLESLFDLYFVQPAIAKAKRDALNAKLTAAGKPPMKA